MYNGIRILHINLDYLRKKYYTNGKLNEFEKLMLIFVEQDRRKIEKITQRKDVKEIMNFLETLNFKPGDAVTYDKEAFVRSCEEDVLQRLEEANKKYNKASEKYNKASEKYNKASEKFNTAKIEAKKIKEQQKELENEKISLAKELKNEGYSIDKILKITKLSKNIVMAL